MITCDNATFVHVPKCGGTYLRTILADRYSLHEECALPSIYNKNQLIGFVRNPYSWYVSWYNFKNTGSDIYRSNDIYKMCNRGPVSFEKYIDNLANPTREFKERYYSVLRTFDVIASLYQVARTWIDSDKPFYEHMYDCYLLNNVKVYKNETMTQELPMILDSVGMLDDEIQQRLNVTPRINISKQVDYKSYYSKELSDLVFNGHQRILTTYNYSLD
jgi:hypothetical protein